MDAGHLSATIERIYAAGTAAESWHDALSAVYALVGATGGGIIRTDAAGSRAIMASMLEPGAVTEYMDHYAPLDHVVAEVEAGPIGFPSRVPTSSGRTPIPSSTPIGCDATAWATG